MLFHDHFYGHRHPESGEPELAAGDVYWTPWDYALADAIQFIADHTNKHGHLLWEQEGEQVEAVIVQKIDKVDAKIEAKQRARQNKKGKSVEPPPGEYHVSYLRLMPGWEEMGWPTFEDWYEKENGKLGITPEKP